MKKIYLEVSHDGEHWYAIWLGYGDTLSSACLQYAFLTSKQYRVRVEEESAVEPVQVEEKAMERDRDSHFQNFARLLLKELDDTIGKGVKRLESGMIYSGADFAQELGQIVARRAYDLVEHSVDALLPLIYTNGFSPTTDIFETIPDMTEWPESETEDE